ncbi:MAG: hypothetical protein COA58_04035 [Bacteroidetes bacterium]|nr:MAG: hypothetical protein COA58_04035 [Bacteroidota bacterium]
MKKQWFAFILLTLSLVFTCQAQDIVNPTFEAWTPSGSPPPFSWEEPTGWKSINSRTEWTSAGVGRTSDAHSDSFACQLRSVHISGGWPSILCNGNPDFSGDFDSPGLDIISGGTPINYKPRFLQGYYKFSNSPLDSGYAIIILKKYNTTTNKVDTVGIGHTYFGESLDYNAFEIEIKDVSPFVTPDSIVIAFYSSNPANPKAPDFSKYGLIIDDLKLAQIPLSTPKEKVIVPSFSIYPNPSTGMVHIDYSKLPLFEGSLYLNIYNSLGADIFNARIERNQNLNLKLANGIYNCTISDAKGHLLGSQKLILAH